MAIGAPSPIGGMPRPPLSSLGVKRIPGGNINTKIFVGGISWSTTDEEFVKHFERYGPVAAAHVMKYRDGTPRGFGYVTFMSEESVDRACGSRNNIGGREVDVKRAVSKEEMENVKAHDTVPGGGLHHGLPPGLSAHPLLAQGYIAGAAAARGFDAAADPARALHELLMIQVRLEI
jgi:RNA recognition motif-containing protein